VGRAAVGSTLADYQAAFVPEFVRLVIIVLKHLVTVFVGEISGEPEV
jgi:hypothetical protein